jgi:hypothetical protein
MQASVYKYFERFNFVVTNLTDQYSRKHKQLIAINRNSLSYKCLKCFAEQNENYDLKKLAYELETNPETKSSIADSLEEIIKKFRVKTVGTTSSNLIRHLKTHHEYEGENCEEEILKPESSKKRKYNDDSDSDSSLFDFGVKNTAKYPRNSIMQKDRVFQLTKMIVKCMLPISIVESDGFREFLMHLNPKFSIPDVYTIKYGTLTSPMIQINSCIQTELDQMTYCNISLDLWSDAIVRAFNAEVCQGINNE